MRVCTGRTVSLDSSLSELGIINFFYQISHCYIGLNCIVLWKQQCHLKNIKFDVQPDNIVFGYILNFVSLIKLCCLRLAEAIIFDYSFF